MYKYYVPYSRPENAETLLYQNLCISIMFYIPGRRMRRCRWARTRYGRTSRCSTVTTRSSSGGSMNSRGEFVFRYFVWISVFLLLLLLIWSFDLLTLFPCNFVYKHTHTIVTNWRSITKKMLSVQKIWQFLYFTHIKYNYFIELQAAKQCTDIMAVNATAELWPIAGPLSAGVTTLS